MRVFLASHGTKAIRMAAYREALESAGAPFREVGAPSRADAVLFLEPAHNKFRSWLQTLQADETLISHPEKCFAYEACDRPVPFLRGLYVNLRPRQHDPQRTRAADYWTYVESEFPYDPAGRGRYLCSFRGTINAPVREGIMAMSGERMAITSVKGRWQSYGNAAGDPDRHQSLAEIRDSSVVLCPRGLAPATKRLYETMQLGRAPVILADEWIPTEGIPWEDFALRVPEERVADLPELLEAEESSARTMGLAARDAWERFLTPPRLMARWLQAVEVLIESGEEVELDWGQRFQWKHRIHPAQGAMRRLMFGRAMPSRLAWS